MSLVLNRSIYRFCFFNSQISEKYGKKCCKYNQNGQPLPLSTASQTLSSLSEFLSGWKLRQQGLRLVRTYYVQDYPSALQYIKQVIKIDMHQFKQCPTYSKIYFIDKIIEVQNGQLLTLELFSLSLKGLSMVDFHLAMRINNIDHKVYQLENIQNQNDYKKQYNKIRMRRDSQRIQKMLDQDQKQWSKEDKQKIQITK